MDLPDTWIALGSAPDSDHLTFNYLAVPAKAQSSSRDGVPIIQVAWTRHSESYMLYGVRGFAAQQGDDIWIILSTISGNGINNGYPCVEAVEVAPGVWERTHPIH